MMWIKTESGGLLNADRVVLFEAGQRALPGSQGTDPGYEKGVTWTVRALIEGDETEAGRRKSQVVLAAKLPSAAAEALMERLWCGVRHAKYVSVPAELDAIRAAQMARQQGEHEEDR